MSTQLEQAPQSNHEIKTANRLEAARACAYVIDAILSNSDSHDKLPTTADEYNHGGVFLDPYRTDPNKARFPLTPDNVHGLAAILTEPRAQDIEKGWRGEFDPFNYTEIHPTPSQRTPEATAQMLNRFNYESLGLDTLEPAQNDTSRPAVVLSREKSRNTTYYTISYTGISPEVWAGDVLPAEEPVSANKLASLYKPNGIAARGVESGEYRIMFKVGNDDQAYIDTDGTGTGADVDEMNSALHDLFATAKAAELPLPSFEDTMEQLPETKEASGELKREINGYNRLQEARRSVADKALKNIVE